MTHSAVELLSEQRKGDRFKLGIFDAGDMRIGIDIGSLSEVCLATELLPIVSTRPEVLGSIHLRGSVIPVLDLIALCGHGKRTTPPDLVVIVKHDDRLLGLSVDKTRGISSFDISATQELYSETGAALPLVRRGIHDGGTVINIVEISKIFEAADLPTISAHRTSPEGTARRGRAAYLTFEVGGATFGMKAITIAGTVPGQVIEAGAVANSRCMGLIEHLGRDVPVIDCAELCGLGAGLTTQKPEVVVVRMSKDMVLGLAVDVIRRIEFIDSEILVPPPAHLSGAATMLTAVYLQEDSTQVFMLDAEVIEKDGDIQDIAELSQLTRKASDVEAAGSGAIGQTGGAGQERRRCLTYTAGRPQASYLTEVVSIITAPKRITPIQDIHPAVRGIFLHNGVSVLLADLAQAVGERTAPGGKDARVLLVQGDAGDVGFLVDSVDGIQVSELIVSEPDDPLGPVVTLLRGSEKTTLPFVDLTELAATVSAARSKAFG